MENRTELKCQSDEIDKLTTAFIDAMKEVGTFNAGGKSGYGPHVSIDDIRESTYKIMLKHGLRISQYRTRIDGENFLVTKTTHISGQWESSYVYLEKPSSDAKKDFNQLLGTQLSYQRRYELYGIFCIKGDAIDADEIDDRITHKADAVTEKCAPINDKQFALLKMKLNGNAEREERICLHYGIPSLEYLPWRHMNDVLKALEK